MRQTRSAVVLLAVAAASTAAGSTEQFRLSAKSVLAVEHGPLVVRLVLRYDGTVPLKVHYLHQALSDARVIAPDGYEGRPISLASAGVGLTPTHTDLKPASEHTATLFLHQRFCRIPAGDATLRFVVTVRRVGSEIPVEARREALSKIIERIRELLPEDPDLAGQLRAHEEALRKLTESEDSGVVKVGANLTLRVSEATPEALQEAHDHADGLLRRKDYDSTVEAIRTVLWTEHADLVPLYFRCLRARQTNGHIELRRFVYARSRESDTIHKYLIDYLATDGCSADQTFFGYWQQDKVDLDRYDIGRLLQPRNIWIKVHTYRTFPELCPERTKDMILKQIARLMRAVETAPRRKGPVQ